MLAAHAHQLAALVPTFDNRRHAVKIAGLRAVGRALTEETVAAVTGAITEKLDGLVVRLPESTRNLLLEE